MAPPRADAKHPLRPRRHDGFTKWSNLLNFIEIITINIKEEAPVGIDVWQSSALTVGERPTLVTQAYLPI